MAEHISSQFNLELENVRTQVLQMGGLVEEQLSNTIAALVGMDATALPPVIENDRAINEMELKIDDECQLIIARRQPAASDLRLVLTVTRIITDLERVGDEVKKIALTAHELISHSRINASQFYDLNRMAHMALGMLRRSLDAFARLDATAVLELANVDEQLDQEYVNQLRSLITYMMEDPRTISTSIDLMFMKKSIERIGDHAHNISEHVVYLAKGVDIRHTSMEEVKKVSES